MSKTACLVVASVVLFASMDCAGAQGPAVASTFGDQGLAGLAFMGHEYLRTEAPPALEWVVLDGSPQRVHPKLRQVHHDSAGWVTTVQHDHGDLEVRYVPEADRLTLHVALANTHDVAMRGFRVRLMGVRFPQPPSGKPWDRNEGAIDRGVDRPPIILARHGRATLAVCRDDYEPYVRFGFAGPHRTLGLEQPAYSIVIDSVVFDSEDEDPTIEPGQRISWRLSLRFAEGEVDEAEAAPDVWSAFLERFPFVLDWPDRRPIGRVFLASGASQHRSPTNPRGWFSDPRVDVTSEQGLKAFGQRLRRHAKEIADRSRAMNGQGIIVWNIEGEENPHPITYIGDPRLVGRFAPEMDRYADDFFRILRDAGLRTGVCIRPSRIREEPRDDGGVRLMHGHWGFDRVAEMSDKIRYAQQRWGCTIFYIDTNTHAYRQRSDGRIVGRPIDAPDMIRLARMHPDVLLIPEFVTPAYRSALVAYHELRAHAFGNFAQTPAAARRLYSHAFSYIIPNDGDIEGRWSELVEGVRRGDILSFDAWWSPRHNEQVKAIYQEAAGPTP